MSPIIAKPLDVPQAPVLPGLPHVQLARRRRGPAIRRSDGWAASSWSASSWRSWPRSTRRPMFGLSNVIRSTAAVGRPVLAAASGLVPVRHALAGLVAVSPAQPGHRAGRVRVPRHRSRLGPGARGDGPSRDRAGQRPAVPGAGLALESRKTTSSAPRGSRARSSRCPASPSAPLHVTANRDGIWLTCPGASLLGQYRQEEPRDAAAIEEVMATMSEESADPFKTMGMGAGGAATLRIEDFQATFKEAQERSRDRADRSGSKIPTSHLARLRHLCRLIIRDRRGFCPINGVLLTLPIGIDTPPRPRRASPTPAARTWPRCSTPSACAARSWPWSAGWSRWTASPSWSSGSPPSRCASGWASASPWSRT